MDMSDKEEQSNSENDIDFYKLNDEIDLNLERIWYNVIVPYLDLDDDMKILKLEEKNLIDFKYFFYNNSKYYRFVRNNIYE